MNGKNIGAKKSDSVTRRQFLTNSAAVSASVLLAGAGRNSAFAAGGDTLRVGLIGCGGRGTGAAINCIDSSEGVQLVAMGDLFGDRLENSMRRLQKKKKDAVKVTKDTCFTGFDAYKKVLDSDVDMVILATPPHFRPIQFEAAVDAGKHVFMEKPVATDPAGARRMLAAAEKADEKNLRVVAGTQRRHHPGYIREMKNIHDGAIGELVAGQCYWNMGTLWHRGRKEEWSEMEYQIRNWLYFTWLSGDHIVEQHVHNIDVINWAFGGPPVSAYGVGGRQVRTGEKWGNIYDHFTIEYVYKNGARVMSMCRQMAGTSGRVSERVVGTKGASNCRSGGGGNPYVLEHAHLIKAIRSGKPLNEAKRVTESTLTAIMGRMSAYTGRELKWDWVLNSSKLDLSPEKYEFGPAPTRPVAMPGKTKLV